MASSLICNQNSYFYFPRETNALPLSTNSHVAPSSSLRASQFSPKLKHRISRASSQDLPTELIEDSKFVPLNADDEKYGPPRLHALKLISSLGTRPCCFPGLVALLLLGFQMEESAEIKQLLKELDGEFLKIIFCTEDMLNLSLWQAVNAEQSNLEASMVAASLPRICFLSGLTGEEMMMFIDAFPECGLEPPVFAALVPNSADKPVTELIEEIMGDHQMLVRSRLILFAKTNEQMLDSVSLTIHNPLSRVVCKENELEGRLQDFNKFIEGCVHCMLHGASYIKSFPWAYNGFEITPKPEEEDLNVPSYFSYLQTISLFI